MKKTFLISLAVATLIISPLSALAWVEPSDSPPNNNANEPINIGAEAQTKLGALTISGDTSATIKGLMVGGDGNNGSNALILQNDTQNLIYGNMDAASQGNLLNLQVEGSSKFIINKDGNIGIGGVAPSTKLHVLDGVTLQTAVVGHGNAIFRFLESLDSDELPNGTGMYLDYSADNNRLNFDSYTSGVLSYHVMTVERDGNVGIGDTTPDYTFDIAGSGYLGAASWVYGSDLRLKENISYIQEGLNIIKQLKPANFDYIKGDKKQVGFIAQEVKKILPNIVTEGKDGMLGMKTESIIPYLVKAIQEQQKEIEILKAKINAK